MKMKATADDFTHEEETELNGEDDDILMEFFQTCADLTVPEFVGIYKEIPYMFCTYGRYDEAMILYFLRLLIIRRNEELFGHIFCQRESYLGQKLSSIFDDREELCSIFDRIAQDSAKEFAMDTICRSVHMHLYK